MEDKVLINSAKCLQCGEILVSTYRHDFQQCSCGNVFVDGGLDYIRHGYINADQYKSLSKTTNSEPEQAEKLETWLKDKC